MLFFKYSIFFVTCIVLQCKSFHNNEKYIYLIEICSMKWGIFKGGKYYPINPDWFCLQLKNNDQMESEQ